MRIRLVIVEKMTPNLNVGDRVRHPTKTEWGIGQILSIQGSKAGVFFVETGTKKMSLSHVTLTNLDPPPSHPLLDRIDPKAAAGDPAIRVSANPSTTSGTGTREVSTVNGICTRNATTRSRLTNSPKPF